MRFVGAQEEFLKSPWLLYQNCLLISILAQMSETSQLPQMHHISISGSCWVHVMEDNVEGQGDFVATV